VVDAFAAMTASRPYRSRSLSKEEAIQELHKNVGTQFDPEVVELFTSVVDRKFHFRGMGSSRGSCWWTTRWTTSPSSSLKLVNEGFDVTAVDSAEEALASMEKAVPDLVVADVLMPGMDGIAMFRKMRGSGAPYAETPPLHQRQGRPADQGRRPPPGRGGLPRQAGRPEGTRGAGPQHHPPRREMAEGRPRPGDVLRRGRGPQEPRHPRHRPDAPPGTEDRLRPPPGEGGEGRIWFENGRIRHCDLGDSSGESAFYEMLRWQEGPFVIAHGQTTKLRTIEMDEMQLMMEGLRRLDEEKKEPMK